MKLEVPMSFHVVVAPPPMHVVDVVPSIMGHPLALFISINLFVPSSLGAQGYSRSKTWINLFTSNHTHLSVVSAAISGRSTCRLGVHMTPGKNEFSL
jgi:hypothetical protein